MRQTLLYVLLSVGLLVALGLSFPQQDTLHAQADSEFELGGQILDFNPHAEEMHRAGMTWLKMQISFRRGGTTGDAQNVINHARSHGFKVLLSIIGDRNDWGDMRDRPNRYYRDYANYLGEVAALNPDAIEVWNEPNIDQEWPAGMINGANYTQMLSRAYAAIKQANPNVMVISGAPAPTGFFGGTCQNNGCDDNVFIQQMRDAGAAQHFDCTGIHYNEGILPPTATEGDPRGNSGHYTRYYPAMVNLYRSVFPNKPLCFTELGYISPSGLGSLPAAFWWGENTSAQEHARWLAQAAELSRDGGVVRLMVVWNVNAPFTSSNPFAGWAMIRQNRQCPACETLGAVMAGTTDVPVRNVYTTRTVRLMWGPVSWATSYQIQVDDRRNFNNPLAYSATVPANTLEATTSALADGTYYWRVRARRDNGSWGAWSAVDSFHVDAP